ncbi:Peptidase family M48 [Jannaschia faecimaris]|uniref:Peptidase family M48 n=1 Tax=Jannaschia faecimaris TaxID=1244108 RepID=A0A1H3U162_9RHOB|nr:M48 family metallopeptidase [Jannaschia faecimaris]SDZ56072.1 Peptidase family M48 [Jannaschia faecimaris]
MSFEVWGDYVDGVRALKRRVRITVDVSYHGRVLVIEPAQGSVVHWEVEDVRQLSDQAPGPLVLGLSLNRAARLFLNAEGAETLLPILGRGASRNLEAPALWPRALIVAGAGSAALAALVFAVLPALAGVLAGFMNPEAEVAMGETHYQMTRELFSPGIDPLRECNDPAGRAALDRLVARVAADVDLPYPLQVAVLDDRESPVLNAYAVAGGRITFLDSLIQTAQSPEEVAAVFAHELGHVVHDDPVRHTLQAASSQAVLAVLVGDLTGGGLMSTVAGQALSANYSRGAETRADGFAYDQLTQAGLPPSAMGTFFTRMRDIWGETDGLIAHFSSHPQLTARIEASARIGDPDIGQPALTPKDWAALRGICG